MKTSCIALLVLAALGCHAQLQPESPAMWKEAKMPDKIDKAVTALQAFAKNRDIAVIEQAVDALEEFDIWSVKADQRLDARHRLLLNWSRVLSAIDSIKEPGFDPESDPPLTRVSPPPGHLSGAAPSLVEDPKVRAQYEAAIAENEKKKARSKLQVLALELEERAIESAHRVVERLYTTSSADQKEIEAVFQEGGLSAPRQVEVREPPKNKPQPEPLIEDDEDDEE